MHMKCWDPLEVTAYWLWEKKFGGLVVKSLVSITSIFTKVGSTRVYESSRVKGHGYIR